jgi:hypothetical protein
LTYRQNWLPLPSPHVHITPVCTEERHEEDCPYEQDLVLASSVALAGTPKSYQVTGPVLQLKDDLIVVQKGKEKWGIARDKVTKVTGDLTGGVQGDDRVPDKGGRHCREGCCEDAAFFTPGTRKGTGSMPVPFRVEEDAGTG